MRDLTTDMVTELTSAGMMPVLMAVMQFDSGTLRMWTGYGDLVWGSDTFTGGGNLIGVSPFSETQDLEAQGISLTMSGIPADVIALALTERSRGRPFQMYLGMINSSGALVADPYRVFTGLMDVIGAKDNGATSTIMMAVENRLIVGQRKKLRRYTSEDQKKLYPDDEGFDLINQLQDKEVVW